jgi:hypothetical protein
MDGVGLVDGKRGVFFRGRMVDFGYGIGIWRRWTLSSHLSVCLGFFLFLDWIPDCRYGMSDLKGGSAKGGRSLFS